MKIVSITAQFCNAELRNWIFVRVETDEAGLVGWGEATLEFKTRAVIGAINAGIVSAGINAFYTQLAFGLVIVVSVVLQTIIERRIRRQSLSGR
jgi:L-alanine-DL-glutamate epimerase-like enolase superfamily enzyme